jgi:hypothetical protein
VKGFGLQKDEKYIIPHIHDSRGQKKALRKSENGGEQAMARSRGGTKVEGHPRATLGYIL